MASEQAADLALHSGANAEPSFTLKFLVSNSFAGTVIGSKGAAVKELMEVSGAHVAISGNQEFYPGTTERVLVLTGPSQALIDAVSYIWELICLQAKATAKGTTRSLVWSPEACKDRLTGVDDIELTAKITVPAAAGGLILGRSGATLRLITETSGALVQMTDKEAALFTQERVVTITGFVSHARLCTQLILQKLFEDREASVYVNRGTRYYASASGVPGLRSVRTPRSRDADTSAASPAVPETTITMTLPNSIIGNIIGKSGATLREMVSLSGAKILISSRDERADGMRLVTITGEPSAAQIAHVMCSEKIRLGQSAKPRVRKSDKDVAGEEAEEA